MANVVRLRPVNHAAMMTGHLVARVQTGEMLRRPGTVHHQHLAGVTALRGATGHHPTGISAKARRIARHVRVMAKAASGHAAQAGLQALGVPLATSHVREGLVASLAAALVVELARAGMDRPEVDRHVVVPPPGGHHASLVTRFGVA